jgi:hypothetical protein
MQDQTFADDTVLYFKGTQSNMDRMWTFLYLFCLTFEAKINLGGNLSPSRLAKRREIGNGDKR